MELPVLGSISTSLDGVTGFKGLNHNAKIDESEFYDEQNITGNLLPVMTSRAIRRKVRTLTKANGLFSHDKLGWIDGTSLYYDGAVVGTVADSEKTVIIMGAYVLIWPDKVYYNTATEEFGSLEAFYTSGSEDTVTAYICAEDGTTYDSYTVSDTEPADPADGDYWLDTSVTIAVLKEYSASSGLWTAVTTVYTKIGATGIGTQFNEMDGVFISGMDDDTLNGSFYIVAKDDDYIVVTALIEAAITDNAESVSVSRVVPDMEYLTECNNRIWGCNSANNEIYACVLGDPKNWNTFAGLTTDSYAVSVGSHGQFTGAVTHLGNILFFKANMIYQIMGTLPSNFNTSSLNVRGVAPGSGKSICIINEILYYHATNSVCAYAQSLPAGISDNLGPVVFQNAVGGALLHEYFLCLETMSGAHELYTYNTDNGIWSKQDAVDVRWFSTLGTELYCIIGNVLYAMSGATSEYEDETAADEAAFAWMLESGEIGLDLPNNKYIMGVQFYYVSSVGATVNVDMMYDSSGTWTRVYSVTATIQKGATVPITTPRCRTLKIKFSGSGTFKLWNLYWRIMTGSDRFAT